MTEAVVFDVMGTLFDLSSLRDRLRAAGAPEGSLEAWFGRMLHGAAALTLVGEFRPFREIGKASLESVLEQLGADVSRADEILQGLGELDPYPDAAAAFEHLRAAGVRIATLTNGAEEHTRRLLARADLEDAVELVIAVDEVRAYKPHPAPYHHAAARLGLPVDRITLVAAHGWDVLGARAAGLGAILDRSSRAALAATRPRARPGNDARRSGRAGARRRRREMTKAALVVLAGTEAGDGLGRVVNAMITAKELKASGDEVALLFDGAGTKWVAALNEGEHRYHALFEDVRDRIVGACAYCANAFGVRNEVEAAEIALLDDFEEHPSLRSYLANGYHVLTF